MEQRVTMMVECEVELDDLLDCCSDAELQDLLEKLLWRLKVRDEGERLCAVLEQGAPDQVIAQARVVAEALTGRLVFPRGAA